MARGSDALENLPPSYRALFERARSVAEADERVRALWLAGSLARGDADAASDLDLLIALHDTSLDEFARGWRDWLAQITPTVIARPLPFLPGSFYAVTPGRERLDVVVEPTSRLATTLFRVRSLVFDRDGLDARVPAALEASGPSRGRIAFLIEEFYRDYGMFDVVATRRDLLLGNEATHLLRGLLYQLFCEVNAPLPQTGLKQWSAKLTPAQRTVLEQLPTGGADFDAMVEAHEAVSRAFAMQARRLAAAHGVSWPADLEAATLRHLRAHALPALEVE